MRFGLKVKIHCHRDGCCATPAILECPTCGKDYCPRWAYPSNGYADKLEVYIGKKKNTEVGLGGRVIKDLTRDLIDRYHRVYTDNFFSSVHLFQDLYDEGIYNVCLWYSPGKQERVP